MAKKSPEEPVLLDGVVKTPEWPNGIQINPHITGCGGKCAPDPDFTPQPVPALPDAPETE